MLFIVGTNQAIVTNAENRVQVIYNIFFGRGVEKTPKMPINHLQNMDNELRIKLYSSLEI